MNGDINITTLLQKPDPFHDIFGDPNVIGNEDDISNTMELSLSMGSYMALNRNSVKSAMVGSGTQIGENTSFSISPRHRMYAPWLAIRLALCDSNITYSAEV